TLGPYSSEHTGDCGDVHMPSRLIRAAFVFFFNDPATTELYTLSLHDALPICPDEHARGTGRDLAGMDKSLDRFGQLRSEEHTSELQSPDHLVCRLLLEKK